MSVTEQGHAFDHSGPTATESVREDVVDVASTQERQIVDLAERGLEPFLALGRYKYLRARAARDVQQHKRLLVLSYPIKGRFEFVVDGVVRSVHPGDAIRIPPGASYRIGAATEPRGELSWLIMSARFNSPAVPDEVRRAISILAEVDGRLVWATSSIQRTAVERLFTLAEQDRDWIVDGMLRLALGEAVLSMLHDLCLGQSVGAECVHRDIARVLGWIEENIDAAPGVDDLIAVSGLSASRFFEVFRSQTGTSPRDYVLRRRLERAMRALRAEPDMTVTELAHSLRFSSSQYFASVFRRYYGCTPTQARDRPI